MLTMYQHKLKVFIIHSGVESSIRVIGVELLINILKFSYIIYFGRTYSDFVSKTHFLFLVNYEMTWNIYKNFYFFENSTKTFPNEF